MEPRRLGRLLARQEEELGALDAAAQQALLAVLLLADEELRTALLRLQEGLPAGQERTPFSAQQARVLLLLVRSATRTLTDRGVGALAAQARAGAALGGRHALELLELDPELAPLLAAVQAAEPGLRLPPAPAADQAPGEEDGLAVGQPLRARMVAQVARDGLLVQRVEASLARYGADLADQMHREVAVGLATNQSLPDIAARLSGLGGVLATARGRGMLIARMETAGAYDVGHREAAGLAAGSINAALGVGGRPPLVMRASEHIDDLRNHPFSQVVHGMTRPMDGKFRVARSDVANAFQRLRSAGRRSPPEARLTGILWPLESGVYVGDTYPAHFHDRGRQHLWRESWDDGSSRPISWDLHQGELKPTLSPGSQRRPAGSPMPVRPGSEFHDVAENRTALRLAQAGYAITQVPEAHGSPDYMVTLPTGERVTVDCYTPDPEATGSSWKREITLKGGQWGFVVVNLERSRLTRRQVSDTFRHRQTAGLRGLIVVDADGIWRVR